MNFDYWMLTEDPKYNPTDDTKALRKMRKCWGAASNYGATRSAKIESLRQQHAQD